VRWKEREDRNIEKRGNKARENIKRDEE